MVLVEVARLPNGSKDHSYGSTLSPNSFWESAGIAIDNSSNRSDVRFMFVVFRPLDSLLPTNISVAPVANNNPIAQVY